MFIRALTAFLVLPGIVAGLIPWILFYSDPWRRESFTLGLLVMAGGLFILLWCIRDFYITGKGTLAPWSPPKRLVIVGLYRICRNPMYIGILVLVFGWAIFATSPLLVGYFVVLIFSFHFRVILYEEPRLSKLFGTEWEFYSSMVPRWLPGLKVLNNSSKTS
jgi:protein-S-isoprenylcysteine O-methyltransferase Ste14